MRPDPHSYADADQPQTSTIDLDLRADFQRQLDELRLVSAHEMPQAAVW